MASAEIKVIRVLKVLRVLMGSECAANVMISFEQPEQPENLEQLE